MRAIRILLVTLLAVAVSDACDPSIFFAPCGDIQDDRLGRRERFLDGGWSLTKVNNQSLPFVLPNGGGTLTSGSMDMLTLYLDEGTCSEPKGTRGQVIAFYYINNASQGGKIGSFEYVNKSGAVTLAAFGNSVVGTVRFDGIRDGGTMSFAGAIPAPNQGSTTYTLEFSR